MKIYIVVVVVLAVSFGAAVYFPTTDLLKGMVASPGIAALFTVLYESFRTYSEEQRERRSWLANNKLRIYSSIHVEAGEVLQAIQEIAELHINHPRREEQILRYFSFLDKLRSPMNEAFLLCNVSVKKSIEAFSEQTNKITHNLLEEAFWPTPEHAAKAPNWQPKDETLDLLNKLLNEMRLELGAKELPE